MAQSQKASLDDSEVSRRIAAKAAKDDFRHLLLDYGNSRNLRAITDIIRTFREQIVGEAKLRAPSLANGNPRDLTTYLRKNTNSRVLLGKTYTLEENKTKVKKNSVEKDNEWGWVVSYLMH